MLCHTWMMDVYMRQNVTLEEVNDRLILRFLGGIVFLSLVIILGIVGNGHVLLIYYRKFKPTNYRIYVIWLAMIDLFNCVICAPFVIYYLLHPVNYPSELFCKIFRFILYFCGVSSTASLVPIAMDRGKKVLMPLKKQISTTHAKVMCVLSLLVGLVFSWPAPILFGINTEPTGIPGLTGRRCLTEDRFVDSKEIVLFNLVLMVFFWLVTAILTIIYSLIGRQICIHGPLRKNTTLQSTITSETDISNNASLSIQSVQRSTVTLLLVTFVYIFSAAVFHILSLIFFLSPDFDCNLSFGESVAFYTFIWSYFVNSVCNPFIYGFRDKTFSKELKRLYRHS